MAWWQCRGGSVPRQGDTLTARRTPPPGSERSIEPGCDDATVVHQLLALRAVQTSSGQKTRIEVENELDSYPTGDPWHLLHYKRHDMAGNDRGRPTLVPEDVWLRALEGERSATPVRS
jgi:hypothetical protein